MNTQRDCPKVIAFPPVVYGGTLLFGLLLQLIWSLPIFDPHPPKWIGGSVALLSAVLAKWGDNTMRRAGTNIKPTEPTITIVQDGPFRFSRNPLYISLTLFYVGVALIFNALIPMLALPFLLLVVHFGIVRREERYLEGKFGDQYRQYRARVRRWI